MKGAKNKKNKLSRRRLEAMMGFCVTVSTLLVLVIVLLGSISVLSTKNNVRNFYATVTDNIVDQHKTYFDVFFAPYFSDLRQFADSEELKSGELQRSVEFLRNNISAFRSSVNDIFFAAADGTAESYLGNKMNVANEDFFARVKKGGVPIILERVETGFFGQGEYIIAKSVLGSNGSFKGAVFYSMVLGSVSGAVFGMSSSDIFFGFAMRTDGVFVIPLERDSILNKSEEYLGQNDIKVKQNFFKEINEGSRGSFVFKTKNYPDEVIVWGKINETDWVVAVDAVISKLDSSTTIFARQIILICSLFILLIVIGAFVAYRIIVKEASSHRLTLQQEGDVDPLTGLWTEALFEEESEKLIKENPDKNYMLLGLDIRGFRIVQQAEGVEVANKQLMNLSRRLSQIAIWKNGFAARGYADHFYLIYQIENKESALKEFDGFLYNGNYLAGRAGEMIPTKTGIVFVGKDYEKGSISNLIGKTSYAKQMVQDNLLKNYSVYDNSMESRVLLDKRIERYTPIAFSHNEFYVVYQPKIELDKAKIIGAEALVRWKSAEMGIVTPDKFIPLFERNGYINRLDFYVYQRVFEFMADRILQNKPIVPISVNMSRYHLTDERFVSKFYNLFKNYNISPEYIEVEILERSLGVADDRAREVAEELHKKGFRVAIDDFGTGESSLSLISKIPADILKLDRKFMLQVEDTANSSEDEFMVVKQIVEMAKSLGKETICEGVETEKQINFLRSINCNYVQGFFYSKPLAESEFVEYLENHI